MRSANMQVLTKNIQAKHPGITIYGIGDAAHKQSSSDHNEDDTPGVRTPQTDADNIPEHRAIDCMLGPSFSEAQADNLVSDLLSHDGNRRRLALVIWNGYEYSAKRGFVKTARSTDKHEDHVHVSGNALDDENTAGWVLGGAPGNPSTDDDLVVDGELGPKTIKKLQKVLGTTQDGKIDERDSQVVKAMQTKLKATVDHTLKVDGDWGPHTTRSLQRYLKSPVDGVISKPKSLVIMALQRRLNEDRF